MRFWALCALALVGLSAEASVVFDGDNDQLRGTLNSSYGDPLTIGVKIKVADHPAALALIAQIGASNSSSNDSYQCRLSASDNNTSTTSTDSLGNGTSAGGASGGWADNTWISVICTINNDDGAQAGNARTVRAESGSSSNDTTRTVAGTLNDIAIGEALNNQNDFPGQTLTPGYIAEVAMWVGDLSAANETAYIANECTANIDPTNQFVYYSLKSGDANALNNMGTDTLGDLTAEGNAALDAEHPTMGSCGTLPTFTAGPSAGAITATTIAVTFTSDTTGTVKGTACANGDAGNAAETLLGQCSGGDAAVSTISQAVVATVSDGDTFSGLAGGTTYDLSFVIDATTDSSLASLADQTTSALQGVTHEVATADTDADTNGTTSAAFTPALNDLLVVGICSSGLVIPGADSTPTVTSSIGGFTFSQVEAVGYGSGANATFVYVSDALVGSAISQTVSVAFDSVETGAIIMVAAVAGMSRDGTDAIRQSATDNNGNLATPDPTFPAAALTGNPTLFFHCNQTNPSGITEPTGWTERADVGYATPNRGGEYASRNSGFTGTQILGGSTSTTGGAVIVELDASVSSFTVGPTVGTITSTTIPVTFTSDTTGTVKGTVCANGAAGNAAETLAGQCSGGGAAVATISQAVVANIGDSDTFTGLSAGTTYDLGFVIDATVDSALSSLVDQATLALPTFTAGPTAGTITSATIPVTFTLSQTGTVYGVVCPNGQTASVAQVKAGNCSGGAAVAAISEPVVATVADGATFSGLTESTTYDLFFAGRRDPDDTAAAASLANQTTEAEASDCDGYPTAEKQCIVLTSVFAGDAEDDASPFFGQGVSIGDVVVIDLVTDPDGYPVTIELDGTVSYAADGNTDRQIIQAEVTDVGGFTLVFNNQAPEVIPPGGGAEVFFEDELLEVGTSVSVDLNDLSEDPEGDEMTYAVTSGTLPTGRSLSGAGVLSGTFTACGEFDFSITITDEWGSTSVVPNTQIIGTTVPDVLLDDAATAIAAIVAQNSSEGCTLTPLAGTAVSSSTVAVGDVVTTDPVAGELVAPDAVITYSLSLGVPSDLTLLDWPFSAGSIYERGVDPDLDLDDYLEDSDFIDIDYSVVSGALPDDWTLNGNTGEISDGSPGDCGSFDFIIEAEADGVSTLQIPSETVIGYRIPDIEGMTPEDAADAIAAGCD